MREKIVEQMGNVLSQLLEQMQSAGSNADTAALMAVYKQLFDCYMQLVTKY